MNIKSAIYTGIVLVFLSFISEGNAGMSSLTLKSSQSFGKMPSVNRAVYLKESGREMIKVGGCSADNGHIWNTFCPNLITIRAYTGLI